MFRKITIYLLNKSTIRATSEIPYDYDTLPV